MKILQFSLITIISGVIGILLSQLVLPAFVSNLSDTLDSMGILDITNIISWAAILMTLLGLILTVVLLSGEYPVKPMLLLLGLSLFGTIFLLCMGSFVYLYLNNPDIFLGSDLTLRILKFYSYPSLVSLTLADPQPIWIVSTMLFLIVFNTCFFYVSGGFK